MVFVLLKRYPVYILLSPTKDNYENVMGLYERG